MRIRSRYFFATGLLAVFFAGLAVITSHLGFALNILQISFLIFLLATVFYLYELR